MCIKDIESLVAIKYAKNQQIEIPQKRRPIDVERFYEPVLTTGDGNCFYNAVSIVLCGNENYSKLLRLANEYILSLYDAYFRDVCVKTCTSYSYEQLIERTSKNRTWANEINVLAMAIVLDRPIAIWSKN